MNNKLAIHGGDPIRNTMLYYGKQTLDNSDKQAILSVLDENNFLTTGPKVIEFEEKCKNYCGAKYALAVNSCTAALHCAVACLNLKESDEVIVSSISFVASANCILYCGAKPIFCDVEEDTMNIDPNKIESLINVNTKAIIAVDFAGQICDFDKILNIAKKHNLVVIEDAAHSWGINLNNKFVGNICDITTLSFHPVKNMTTCEGGMILTNNENLYNSMLSFRQHGIVMDYKKRDQEKKLVATMNNLGYNYRIPDILCSLGISQLSKLDSFINKRLELSNIYKDEINKLNDKYKKNLVSFLKLKNTCAYHIFVVKLNLNEISVSRDEIFHALKAENIGVNLHYIPIYKHPYYQEKFPNIFLPICEKLYSQILTLPLYPNMCIDDIKDVMNALEKVIKYYLIKI